MKTDGVMGMFALRRLPSAPGLLLAGAGETLPAPSEGLGVLPTSNLRNCSLFMAPVAVEDRGREQSPVDFR